MTTNLLPAASVILIPKSSATLLLYARTFLTKNRLCEVFAYTTLKLLENRSIISGVVDI